MELREILEALDTAAKEKDGTAIIPRNLAEDARDARKKVEDPEDKARMRLLLEAVGEKAEREYPAYFRAVR